MRVLLTGPSSFSGVYFAQALSKSGHEVTCSFTQPNLESYTGVRGERAKIAASQVNTVFSAPFGSEPFLDLVKNQPFHAMCHHGAWTVKYRKMDYDIQTAFATNTHNIQAVMKALADNGCQKVVVTGSIFEGNCGKSDGGEVPFSPYGMIKQFTTKTVSFYTRHLGMSCGRFVIPNPFGAMDNTKLIDHFCRMWFAGEIPEIWTPMYVRDNIHVELLAKGFVHFLEQLPPDGKEHLFEPSGYVSSMAEFVTMVANEMRSRLSLDCPIKILEQSDFSQPMTLVNRNPLAPMFPEWKSSTAWDAIAKDQQTLQAQR